MKLNISREVKMANATTASAASVMHASSHNDSFAAMESAGRLIRSLGNGELLKQYVCD